MFFLTGLRIVWNSREWLRFLRLYILPFFADKGEIWKIGN